MYLTLQDLHYFLFQSEFQEKVMFTMAYLHEVHFKRNSHHHRTFSISWLLLAAFSSLSFWAHNLLTFLLPQQLFLLRTSTDFSSSPCSKIPSSPGLSPSTRRSSLVKLYQYLLVISLYPRTLNIKSILWQFLNLDVTQTSPTQMSQIQLPTWHLLPRCLA